MVDRGTPSNEEWREFCTGLFAFDPEAKRVYERLCGISRAGAPLGVMVVVTDPEELALSREFSERIRQYVLKTGAPFPGPRHPSWPEKAEPDWEDLL